MNSDFLFYFGNVFLGIFAFSLQVGNYKLQLIDCLNGTFLKTTFHCATHTDCGISS